MYEGLLLGESPFVVPLDIKDLVADKLEHVVIQVLVQSASAILIVVVQDFFLLVCSYCAAGAG